ncbi:MAG: pyridoxal 5'-phosphate synthase glutaminase subunit PdxT [Acidimicrobiales bacterium]
MPAVGVLALQGAFRRHVEALHRCGADPVEVRTPAGLDTVDALVIPGGESTTMVNLLDASELTDPVGKRLADGMPTLGTCAGMILLATTVTDGRPGQFSFAVLDVEVRRNGYGRQINSFEADLEVAAVGAPPVRGVFIRAPKIESVGPEVEVLAELDDDPVLVRSGPILASSFHPELTGDDRLHRLFLASLADQA